MPNFLFIVLQVLLHHEFRFHDSHRMSGEVWCRNRYKLCIKIKWPQKVPNPSQWHSNHDTNEAKFWWIRKRCQWALLLLISLCLVWKDPDASGPESSWSRRCSSEASCQLEWESARQHWSKTIWDVWDYEQWWWQIQSIPTPDRPQDLPTRRDQVETLIHKS